MKKHFRDMSEEERTSFLKRRKHWTWASVLAAAGSIAAVAVAWPQFSALAHWTVAMMDVVDDVKTIKINQADDRAYMKSEFDIQSSNFIYMNWQITAIKHRINLETSSKQTTALAETTNIFGQ